MPFDHSRVSPLSNPSAKTVSSALVCGGWTAVGAGRSTGSGGSPVDADPCIEKCCDNTQCGRYQADAFHHGNALPADDSCLRNCLTTRWVSPLQMLKRTCLLFEYGARIFFCPRRCQEPQTQHRAQTSRCRGVGIRHRNPRLTLCLPLRSSAPFPPFPKPIPRQAVSPIPGGDARGRGGPAITKRPSRWSSWRSRARATTGQAAARRNSGAASSRNNSRLSALPRGLSSSPMVALSCSKALRRGGVSDSTATLPPSARSRSKRRVAVSSDCKRRRTRPRASCRVRSRVLEITGIAGCRTHLGEDRRRLTQHEPVELPLAAEMIGDGTGVGPGLVADVAHRSSPVARVGKKAGGGTNEALTGAQIHTVVCINF